MFGEWNLSDNPPAVFNPPMAQTMTVGAGPGISSFAQSILDAIGSNAGSNAGAAAPPLQSTSNCTPAYIAKYQKRFGVYPMFCGGSYPQPQPPIMPIGQCPANQIWDPISGTCVYEAAQPVSPVTRIPARRHRPGRPHYPSAEMCPIRGYISRQIPGVAEYQNFRCTPGQPVRIDAGLARAGAQGAYQRAGLADLLGDDLTGDSLPTWLLAGVVVFGLVMFSKGGRRRR